MKKLFFAGVVCGAAVLMLADTADAAEKWELGFSGGYGFAKDAHVANASGEVAAGLKSGAAMSIFGGNQVRSWLSGEVRYTYRQNDYRLSGNGTEAIFSGDSHAVHYDFVFHTPRREGSIQPFFATGAGIRFFRGTGQETRNQPSSQFAILTKTNEVRPLLSVSAGVKVPVSRLMSIRAELRDYITPFPRDVIAPVPRASTRGWIHDFVPMFGLSFTF